MTVASAERPFHSTVSLCQPTGSGDGSASRRASKATPSTSARSTTGRSPARAGQERDLARLELQAAGERGRIFAGRQAQHRLARLAVPRHQHRPQRPAPRRLPPLAQRRRRVLPAPNRGAEDAQHRQHRVGVAVAPPFEIVVIAEFDPVGVGQLAEGVVRARRVHRCYRPSVTSPAGRPGILRW